MEDSVREFLEAPRVAYLSSIDPNGFPHTVPVWYIVDGDDIITIGPDTLARYKNIVNNPKGSMTIGGGPEDPAGYLIQGTYALKTDIGHVVLKKILNHYMDEDGAQGFLEQVRDQTRIIFRLSPTKIIRVH